MNEANLTSRIGAAATGDGFRRSKNLNLLTELRATTGLDLDATTTVPLIAALEVGGYGLNCAAGQTHVGLINWTVPEDYDESQDELLIRTLAQMHGSADTAIHITASVYRKRAGIALVTETTTKVSGHIASGVTTTTAAALAEIDLSDLSLLPGDALTIRLTADAHATDALYVYGAWIVYRSNLAFSDESDR